MHQQDDNADVAGAYKELKKQYYTLMKRELKRDCKKDGKREKRGGIIRIPPILVTMIPNRNLGPMDPIVCL